MWRESWQSECVICSVRLARVAPRKWLPIQSVQAMLDARQAQAAD